MLSKKTIVIIIISLKGGVGKSTIAASLAHFISEVLSRSTAIWDLDITSPSIPKILGISGKEIQVTKDAIIPIKYSNNLKVLSIDFFLPSSDQPIIFKGVRKASIIQQFLKTVDFGNIDYLILDTPPTTSEELITILELFDRERLNIVFITQPSSISNNSVIKSIRYLKEKGYPIKGLLSNMGSAICPNCGNHHQLFYDGGKSVENIACEYGIPFLGSIPIGEEMKKSLLIGEHFKTIASNIVSSKSVSFKPTRGKIGTVDKLMLAFSIKRGLKKLEKGDK
jgi:Mrp family chromosome partitioning ATPase